MGDAICRSPMKPRLKDIQTGFVFASSICPEVLLARTQFKLEVFTHTPRMPGCKATQGPAGDHTSSGIFFLSLVLTAKFNTAISTRRVESQFFLEVGGGVSPLDTLLQMGPGFYYLCLHLHEHEKLKLVSLGKLLPGKSGHSMFCLLLRHQLCFVFVLYAFLPNFPAHLCILNDF